MKSVLRWKERKLWIEAIMEARHDLLSGKDPWRMWNDVEDFFWLWLMELEAHRP